MNPWMAGLGAGLESIGSSAMQILAQQQAQREREKERERLEKQQQEALARANRQYDQGVAQWAFQNHLTPMDVAQAQQKANAQAGETLGQFRAAALPGALGIGLGDTGDALATEAQQRMGRGRAVDLEFSDGNARRYFQRYEDSPQGIAEATAKREDAKANATQHRAIGLEEAKQRLKRQAAFNTLQRLGQVPQGIKAFEDAPDEAWDDLLQQYRDERLAKLRKSDAPSAVGTLSEITDDEGNVWQRNTRTGQLSPLTKPDGTPFKAPPKSGGTPTEAEAKAAAYAQRMLTAKLTLEGLDALKVNGQPSRTQAWMQAGGGMIPDSWAEGTANALRSPEQQVYNNAVGDFINAFLRRDSGAAISKEEWARYAPMFTDRPDDSPEVRAQKKANRAANTQLMIKQAGKAWSPEIEGISASAATQAFLPWTKSGTLSPTEALQQRNRR